MTTPLGLVLADDLGPAPTRTARRRGLVLVQPHVFVARSQPVGLAEHAEAISHSVEAPWAFLGATALWLRGLAPAPQRLQVGVPFRREVVLRRPAVVRQVSAEVLRGVQTRDGHPLVRLEVAAVQRAHGLDLPVVVRMVDELLGARATTTARLRDACRRGLAGSAVMRAALQQVCDGAETHQRALVRALRELGVRDLETEVRLVSRTGAVAYLDALHRPSRRALEIDGAVTHGTAAQQLVDRRRDRWVLADHGLETLRVAVLEVQRDVWGLAHELAPLFTAR